MKILVGDTDRDSLYEMILHQSPAMGNDFVIYEQITPDSILFGSPFIIVPYPESFIFVVPWLLGDYDQDGLYDIVCAASWTDTPPSAPGISIFEQPDSFSYPTIEIYRDTTYSGLQAGITGGDVDGDGIPEILKSDAWAILLFETRGNDVFTRVYEDMTWNNYGIGPMSTHAIEDFDKDGKNEFVVGGLGWTFIIYEAVDNDTFQFIWESPQVPTANLYDVKALPDMDKDSLPEYMVKGWTSDGWTTCLIYEAVANDTYNIIWQTVYTGQWHGIGQSDIGDVDMDGEPELVLNTGNGFRVLKAIGNNQFQDIGGYTVNPGFYMISNIAVSPDIDRNGINEIITSGEEEISGQEDTRFFEAILTSVSEKVEFLIPNPDVKILGLKNYEIYNVLGQKISCVPTNLEYLFLKRGKGIYFIYLKDKRETIKIIKIK